MATYKQRTPYQRHAVVYSDEEDTHTVQTSTSNHQTQHHHSHNSHHHQHHAEDGILDNTSDREWTSIRNSASARARARQQQYLDQQQQRTREWQFVLSQHRHHSFSNTTASRGISSDEYDEVFSAAGPPSIVASPHIADHTTAVPASTRVPTGEHSSVLGFSDLTSDGLESIGESEDLGVWSHEDDDDVLSTPALRRSSTSSSSPLVASTASLSHIPRPSFADSSSRNISSGLVELKFQNQMPFHDGSGNFVERAPSVRESDVESERGRESSSSRNSSVLRQYRRPKDVPVRRPISSSEFKAVIQNIADLQRTSTTLSPFVQSSSRQRSLEGYASSSTGSTRPTFTYPHVVSKRPIFNIYESEMEDLSEMVELPVKMGWLQAFEQALRSLKPQEHELHADDNAVSPIKAWAQHLSHEEPMSVETRRSTTTSTATKVDQQQHVPSPSDEAEHTAESQARLDQVQQNMAAASVATLKRLQTRKRANPHHRDPMQIDFAPTVAVDADTYRRNRRVLSRSTGTSTSTAHDTNLLAVVLSTLRRFRDHVQSNFMFSEFYDEDERSQHLSRTLGPDGDLGIEWSTGDLGTAGVGGTDRTVTGTTAAAAVAALVGSSLSTSSRAAERRYRRHERTPSVASSSARSSVRRVNSDCGLESMKSYRSHDSSHPIHSSHYRPSLVE